MKTIKRELTEGEVFLSQVLDLEKFKKRVVLALKEEILDLWDKDDLIEDDDLLPDGLLYKDLLVSYKRMILEVNRGKNAFLVKQPRLKVEVDLLNPFNKKALFCYTAFFTLYGEWLDDGMERYEV